MMRSLIGLWILLLPATALADLGGTQPGELPFGGQFEKAESCATCHGGGTEAFGILPYDGWAGTMMGNAARDPIFEAALAIANQDEPGIGGFCLRCHSPIAFVRGHTSPPDGSAFDEIDLQGIGCDTCHRALATGAAEAPYWIGDAQLVYSSSTDKHGPYADSNAIVHGSVADEALSSSAFCGQCHSVTNPLRKLRDSSGKETPFDFPLDTTYQEWQQSIYGAPGGASCIACHTRAAEGKAAVVSLPGAPLRDKPRDHVFAGGNLFGIRAIMEKSPDRANAYANSFALALARTEETLANAVRVEILSAPDVVIEGASFDLKVRVTNLTGHKFPTGYVEGRRAFVSVVLVDEDLAETFLVGQYDESTGVILNESETHVYRAQQGHWNGNAAVPSESLATHDIILSDSRIPPEGFQATIPTMPTDEIDYRDGNGGYRHWDEVLFSLKAPLGRKGKAKLVARVYYQSITRAYMEHLAHENHTNGAGQWLSAAYEKLGGAPPTLLASADAAITLGSENPTTTGAGGNGGNGNGGAGGASSDPADCHCSVPQTRESHSLSWLLCGLGIFFLRRHSRALPR